MVNFFDEISKLSGISMDVIGSGYKLININSKIIYIEGFKELITFSSEEMFFKMKKHKISIKGSNLELKSFGKDYALILGDIKEIIKTGDDAKLTSEEASDSGKEK